MNEFFDLSPEVVNDQLSSNYTGEKDIYLDFQGNGEKITAIKMKDTVRRVAFQITNTTTSQKKLALTPASYDTLRGMLVYDDTGTLKVKVTGGGAVAVTNFNTAAIANDVLIAKSDVRDINNAGHNIDCVFDDGIIYAESADPTKYVKVTAKSKNASAKHFINFIKQFPSAFIGIQIVSNVADMFEAELTLQECTPFKGAGQENRIPFGDFYTDQSNNNNKIMVEGDFQLDANTLAQVVIPALSVVTMTFVASVIHSSAAALKTKVRTAVVNGKKLAERASRIGQPKE